MQLPTARAAPHVPAPADAKWALRQAMRDLRTACDPRLGVRLGEHLLAACPPLPGEIVAGYWPFGGEIDIRPLLLALVARGHGVALPATHGDDAPLSFHRWQPGAALERDARGTWRPAYDAVVPDVVLVPLLAFDRAGRRLGYGAGFYDRTLAELHVRMTIGCAFAVQEVERVPVEAHDRRLDAIATEDGVILVE